MKFLALIPARYASTRFPGKPLADLMGKPMIQHVYEKAHAVFDACYVATDDPRIEQAVLSFGGRVVMTSSEHPSGTDRCREALVEVERETGTAFDVVVNIQGDEPFVSREQLELIQQCFEDSGSRICHYWLSLLVRKRMFLIPTLLKWWSRHRVMHSISAVRLSLTGAVSSHSNGRKDSNT